jgi:hypothetical protein
LNRIDPPPNKDTLPELKQKYKARWQKLSEGKKYLWIRQTFDQVAEYLEELRVYKNRNPGYVEKPFKFRVLITKEEQAIWEQNNGRPKRPPTDVKELLYLNLIKDPEFCDLPIDESKRAAEEHYKNLDSYNKEMYKLNFRGKVLEYRKDIEAYYAKIPEFLKPFVLPTIPKKFHSILTSVVDKVSADVLEDEEHEQDQSRLENSKWMRFRLQPLSLLLLNDLSTASASSASVKFSS